MTPTDLRSRARVGVGMLKLVLIFLGSGVGGLFRYALSGWVQRAADATFPIGTLAVNLLGCFLIGLLAAFSGRALLREELRAALMVGVLGGFTTFSAFGVETFDLLSRGRYLLACCNIVLSVAVGLAAVWAGYRLGDSC